MQGRTKVSIFLSLVLLPFSWLWAGVLLMRHAMYNRRWIRSEKGAVPTLVLGNLAMGGTGKTPHAIAMLQLLSEKKVAFLSRGYGRDTRGFVIIDTAQSAAKVGDEPLLVKRRLPHVMAAVCENRVEGIRQLVQSEPAIEGVVLDDAFQHRPLQGDINVVLTTFQEPFFQDHLLPAGRLRDVKSALHRAHAVIVSKCPANLTSEDRARFMKSIPVRPLFFTSLEYGRLRRLNGSEATLSRETRVLLIAGIARPAAFVEHVSAHYQVEQTIIYRDHQAFAPSDLEQWKRVLDTFAPAPNAIVTTEKDAMRLMEWPLAAQLPLYYLPVEVKWEAGDAEQVRDLVLKHWKRDGKL